MKTTSFRETVAPLPKLTSQPSAVVRVDTLREVEYYRNGGILPYVLRQLAV
jgi:aconitate hydratase